MKDTTLALSLFAAGALVLLAAPGWAGTKYQTSLVPNVAGTMPGFSARGSSTKIDGSRHVWSGKLKNAVDGTGARITTDPNVTGDEYSVQVDLELLAAPGGTTTLTATFDLSNGNGKFSVPFTPPGVLGDGIAVRAVRVYDNTPVTPALIGGGGVANE